MPVLVTSVRFGHITLTPGGARSGRFSPIRGTVPLVRTDQQDGDWERLAELLISRRVQLGYQRRSAFSRDRGLPNDRVIAAVENYERTNFAPATIALIEQIYEWEPGSIRSVLAGGMPRPKSGEGANVGASAEDEDTLLYRRPSGLSDREWEHLKAETREYIEWQMNRVARER